MREKEMRVARLEEASRCLRDARAALTRDKDDEYFEVNRAYEMVMYALWRSSREL